MGEHACEYCGHNFARDPQPTHHCDPAAVRNTERERLAPYVEALDILEKAAARALPYLVDCIHEIACEEEHGDGEPCPADTKDEPVRKLREGIAAACRARSKSDD